MLKNLRWLWIILIASSILVITVLSVVVPNGFIQGNWELVRSILSSYRVWISIIIVPLLLIGFKSRFSYAIIPFILFVFSVFLMLIASSDFKEFADIVTSKFNVNLFSLGIAIAAFAMTLANLFERPDSANIAKDILRIKNQLNIINKEFTDAEENFHNASNKIKRLYNRIGDV